MNVFRVFSRAFRRRRLSRTYVAHARIDHHGALPERGRAASLHGLDVTGDWDVTGASGEGQEEAAEELPGGVRAAHETPHAEWWHVFRSKQLCGHHHRRRGAHGPSSNSAPRPPRKPLPRYRRPRPRPQRPRPSARSHWHQLVATAMGPHDS